jgi:hypothetical protein
MLRSRREDYAGSWLPEPIVGAAADHSPERDAVLADSVGLALRRTTGQARTRTTGQGRSSAIQ